MCLILFAYHMHPEYKLVLVGNRDEFYKRPTRPLGFWQDHPHILAGRDLEGGGTWLGVTRTGRIAAITNYRDPAPLKTGAPSRGLILAHYLASSPPAHVYLNEISKEGHHYNGFNLLMADAKGLYYYSNRGQAAVKLPPGLYGLSNHLLDTAWPKVTWGKRRLEALVRGKNGVEIESFFRLLTDRTVPPRERLPDTGVGPKWERLLAPMFIASRTYGTRSSSLLFVSHAGRISFAERTYPVPPGRLPPRTRLFRFSVPPESAADPPAGCEATESV